MLSHCYIYGFVRWFWFETGRRYTLLHNGGGPAAIKINDAQLGQ